MLQKSYPLCPDLICALVNASRHYGRIGTGRGRRACDYTNRPNAVAFKFHDRSTLQLRRDVLVHPE